MSCKSLSCKDKDKTGEFIAPQQGDKQKTLGSNNDHTMK